MNFWQKIPAKHAHILEMLRERCQLGVTNARQTLSSEDSTNSLAKTRFELESLVQSFLRIDSSRPLCMRMRHPESIYIHI